MAQTGSEAGRLMPKRRAYRLMSKARDHRAATTGSVHIAKVTEGAIFMVGATAAFVAVVHHDSAALEMLRIRPTEFQMYAARMSIAWSAAGSWFMHGLLRKG